MHILRESARGRECQVRIENVCSFNPETTVLAHLNGAGMGQKVSDIHGAFCCNDCHSVIDGRRFESLGREELKLFHLEAVIRTQEIWLEEGLISISQ